MALAMTPLEFLQACDEAPREMAIFRTVQDAMRSEVAKKREEASRERHR